MIYYKQIYVPNFKIIQEKTQLFLDKMNWYPKMGFHSVPWKDYTNHCPEILTAFDAYGLKPLMAATYITYRQEDAIPHIDYRNPNLNICRINLPIKNCEGTFTEFFTGGEYVETLQKSEINAKPGERFLIVKPGSVPTKVDQVEMTGPTVMRVQEPHRVAHLHDKQRINLTIYTDKDPVFLLE